MKDTYIELNVGRMYYYLDGIGDTIVFLHGWGQNFYTYSEIAKHFSSDYQILGIDFLGFGNSDEPNSALSVDEYTTHLEKLLNELGINNPIIIAHSFGGRIAIKFATRNPVKTMILVSSAGIKKRNIKHYYKIYKYKLLKKIYKICSITKYENLVSKSGSTDYRNATDIMKQTLSKVVNYNSIKDMKLVKTKTYLIWGIHDDVTTYSDGLKINKLIKHSKMIPFYNSGHFSYIQEENKFINTIKKII